MEWADGFEIRHTEFYDLIIHRPCGHLWRIKGQTTLLKLNRACENHLKTCEAFK